MASASFQRTTPCRSAPSDTLRASLPRSSPSSHGGAIGFLAVRETALVYVGAGSRGYGRLVPDSTTSIPWDTVRVRDHADVPVLLLESRIDSAPERPWVLYLHGNAGLLGARGNVRRYALLREAGFNVLAVEYRGYGASAAAGSPTEPGLYADADAAWTYLTRTRAVAPRRIAIYGWSLGGGVATYVAATHGAGALVTEGTFTSLPDLGAAQYPWVPVRLIARNRFENIERARRLTLPWILFHARNDEDVPFAHAERLAKAASRARLVPLAGDHGDAVLADRDVALAALRELQALVR